MLSYIAGETFSRIEVPQICPRPPSTLISTPVMYEASWDARNATVAATSSGCPKRFIDTFVRSFFSNSSTASCGSPDLSKIGVKIGPGATVLTRMPRSTSSAAAVRARQRNAALVAEYALVPMSPLVSATLVFRMIGPPSFKRGLDREVCALDVDIELLVVSALQCLGNGAELPNARVHKQNINFAQLLRNFYIELIQVREFRNVCLDR